MGGKLDFDVIRLGRIKLRRKYDSKEKPSL